MSRYTSLRISQAEIFARVEVQEVCTQGITTEKTEYNLDILYAKHVKNVNLVKPIMI